MTHYPNRSNLFVTLLVLMVTACNSETPSPPLCRADTDNTTVHENDGDMYTACIIRVNDSLLTLNDNGRFSIPRAKPILGETLSCAAHRSVWSHYGFNVLVGNPLGYDQENGTLYFDCQLEDNTLPNSLTYSLPRWSKSAEHFGELKDPFELSHKEWRPWYNEVAIRDYFNKGTIQLPQTPE